jgi:hypothetical protein
VWSVRSSEYNPILIIAGPALSSLVAVHPGISGEDAKVRDRQMAPRRYLHERQQSRYDSIGKY